MLQRRNSASPSFHSPDWRSNVRGVDATVKLATAAPDGVKRSSGSAVRVPIRVIAVAPAMFPCPQLAGSSPAEAGAAGASESEADADAAAGADTALAADVP